MDNSVGNNNVERKKRDCSGQNNNFYNHKHSQQTREVMSQKAKEREAQYRKWRDSQHHISMDEFLSNNPSVKEYIKVLASKIIKEEVDKMIWKKQQQQIISIPNI